MASFRVSDTGNLHKWCFCPKGSAFLWVAPELQATAQAPVISHEWKAGFQDRFIMQGTLDDTAFLAAPAALRFVQMMGGFDSIYRHNHGLICWAAAMLAKRWGTELLVPTARCSTMACIKLPDDAVPATGYGEMMGVFWDRFRIVAPVVGCPGVEGGFVRISAQIYNEKEDYNRLAEAVLELQREAF